MGNAVVNAVSWQPAGVPDTSKILFALGHISLVADSVLVALSYRASPDRRHLVVALTDGEDICSLAPGDSLQRAAERSGGVFHWINVELGGPVAATRDALGQGVSAKIPMTDYWKRSAGVESACRNPAGAPVRDIGRFLSDATRLTGGSVHTARSVADHDAIVGFFDAILDDFRRSYIVHYVPEGVPRTGWHRLRVELQEKGLTVRARPGYWGADAVPDAR
jgi:hypothetical protein